VVAEQDLTTAGKPAKIILVADKPSVENNWNDVVYVTATVTDEEGHPCLAADNKISFSIEGQGVIAAVDNGDVSSSEPYAGTARWAYKGTCIAIVKASAASGVIKLTARADGLKDGTATIGVK
jgi:beta-galactosidase